jgi:CRP-like cAMP-binding protein
MATIPPPSTSFLPRFSPHVRDKILSLSEPSHFTAGQTIFEEDAHSLYLYVVKQGRVAIEAHMPGWGVRTIDTLGPGELFSWSALIEPRLETASACALEETEVLRIKGGALTDACCEDPEFGFEIYRTLAEVISERLVAMRGQLLSGVPWPQETR